MRSLALSADDLLQIPVVRTRLTKRRRISTLRVVTDPPDTRYGRTETGNSERMTSNVLIVEDSADVRSGLQIALESQGYRVRAAVDGRDGIKMFREWRPDIALLDIKMPRMSGIDVCTLIRHESDVPVIMFSGVDESDDVRMAIQRGATDYVLKDTGFRELLNRVSKHLKRRAADVLLAPRANAAGQLLPFTPQGESESPVAPESGSRKPAPQPGLNVKTVKVDAPALNTLDSGGALENLIIVAHSEPESLNELTGIAARIGFEVATAMTGREAIEILAMRRPKLLVVGNVLTDMSCMNVVQAAANHPLGELIGVVLALGKRSPELARRARYLGVQEVVFRPWGQEGRMDMAMRSALAATRAARSRLEAAA